MDSVLILLCLIAFLAGFVDAIVGGGGLIQTPVIARLLILSIMTAKANYCWLLIYPRM